MSEEFSRRKYSVEGEMKRVVVSVQIDGRPFAQIPIHDVGLFAIVRKPGATGVDFEIVSPGGARVLDEASEKGHVTEPLADWQRAALGV
jgi:hypothetical protein